MGLTSSSDDHWEQPSEKHEATLYYFSGRGLGDQIRWMLAATEISFTQKIISQRSQFQQMATAQLPFAQLPLLQIDGLELVQTQAIVRYLARRAGLQGLTADEVVKADMIAEAVRDLLSNVTAAPFKRDYFNPETITEAPTATLATPPTPPSSTPSSSTATSAIANPLPTAAPITSASSSSTNNSIVKLPATSSSSSSLPPAPYDNALQHNPTAESWRNHVKLMKEKWQFFGTRFEAILRSNRLAQMSLQKKDKAANSSNNNTDNDSASNNNNNNKNNSNVSGDKQETAGKQAKVYYMVGAAMTYADILVAHVTTWFVEECGPEIVQDMPLLVNLQNTIIQLPGIRRFIQSLHYFPLGDRAYCDQVERVLDRKIRS